MIFGNRRTHPPQAEENTMKQPVPIQPSLFDTPPLPTPATLPSKAAEPLSVCADSDTQSQDSALLDNREWRSLRALEDYLAGVR